MRIIILGTAALVLIIVFFVYRNNNIRIDEIESSVQSCNYELGELKRNFLLSTAREGKLDLKINLFSFDDTLTLKELVKRPTIVYKFSSLDCSDCVSQQLAFINQISADNSLDILILYEVENITSFKNYKNKLSKPQLIWGVKDFSISDHVYFILEPEGIVHSSVLVTTDNTQFIQQYLKNVAQKLNVTSGTPED